MVNREILCVSSSVDWYQDQMHPGLEIIHSMLYSLLSQCIFTMFIFCSNCHITRFERPFVIIWTIKFVFARSPLITKTLSRKSWLVRKRENEFEWSGLSILET